MSKQSKIGLGTFLFGVAVFAIHKFSGARNIKYDVTDLKINKENTNLKHLAVDVVVSVINPTSSLINLKNILGQIEYKGKTIGQINYLTPQVIQPNTVTKITIPVVMPLINLGLTLGASLVKNINTGVKPTFVIKGSLGFSFGSLSFESVKTLG